MKELARKEPRVHVIREIYDGEDAFEKFEAELEKALVNEIETIIIEPSRIGDSTSRWIKVGNCLHQTATLTGLASVATGVIWTDKPFHYGFCAVSAFCAGLYAISWNCDPCIKYQIETNPLKLKERVPNYSDFSSPVVLKFADNKKARWVHRICTTAAISICLFSLYKSSRT